jgi:hypothetical protein
MWKCDYPQMSRSPKKNCTMRKRDDRAKMVLWCIFFHLVSSNCFLEIREFQQEGINTKSSERVAIVCYPSQPYKGYDWAIRAPLKTFPIWFGPIVFVCVFIWIWPVFMIFTLYKHLCFAFRRSLFNSTAHYIIFVIGQARIFVLLK